MIYRVRIFLWNSAKSSSYLGEQDLKVRPAVGQPIKFRQYSSLRLGRVKDIAPANWDPSSAVIPAVHVEWYPVRPAAEHEAPSIVQALGIGPP